MRAQPLNQSHGGQGAEQYDGEGKSSVRQIQRGCGVGRQRHVEYFYRECLYADIGKQLPYFFAPMQGCPGKWESQRDAGACDAASHAEDDGTESARWHAIGGHDAEFVPPLQTDDPEQGSTGKGCEGGAEVEDESHRLFGSLDDAEPCGSVGVGGVNFELGRGFFQVLNDGVDMAPLRQVNGKRRGACLQGVVQQDIGHQHASRHSVDALYAENAGVAGKLDGQGVAWFQFCFFSKTLRDEGAAGLEPLLTVDDEWGDELGVVPGDVAGETVRGGGYACLAGSGGTVGGEWQGVRQGAGAAGDEQIRHAGVNARVDFTHHAIHDPAHDNLQHEPQGNTCYADACDNALGSSSWPEQLMSQVEDVCPACHAVNMP